MYRVSYYINNSNAVAFKEFDNFKEAMDFSIKQPNETILEIKQYAETTNIQNESDNSR